MLWRRQVGGPGERADGLGIYPGSSLQHLPFSHLLPITSTYLEKIILDLQHLSGQLSDAAECHSWDTVDNGQVNQPTEGIKRIGEEKKRKMSPKCHAQEQRSSTATWRNSLPASPSPFPFPPFQSNSILPSPWGSPAAGQSRNMA